MNGLTPLDRKSTRLNSSHLVISYAVFCFKKTKNVVAHRGRSTCKRMGRIRSNRVCHPRGVAVFIPLRNQRTAIQPFFFFFIVSIPQGPLPLPPPPASGP